MCDLENLVNEEDIGRDWAAAPRKKKYIYLHVLASIVVQRVFLKLDNEQYVLWTFDDTISHLVYLKVKEPRRGF
jgi:hypothetical protein